MSKHRTRERYWVHSDPTGSTDGGAKCRVCHKPYRDGFLCSRRVTEDDPKGGCSEQLEKWLGDIPGLADDLEISRTRQSVGAGRNGSRGNEFPLPWDSRATVAEGALRNELVGLVRDLDPKPVVVGGPVCILCKHGSCGEFLVSTWPRDTPAAMSRWLLKNIGQIRQHPAADEIWRSVRGTVTAVEWVVDRRPDRWFAGPCRAYCARAKAPRTVGSLRIFKGDEMGERTCVADLYALPGAKTVECDLCGHAHDASDRKAWLLAYSYDLLETATTISRAIEAFDGRAVTPERIRKWAERGRIAAKGERPLGGRVLPTYRVGDVIDLLNAEAAEAERRAEKRDAERRKSVVLAS